MLSTEIDSMFKKYQILKKYKDKISELCQLVIVIANILFVMSNFFSTFLSKKWHLVWVSFSI